MDALLCELDAVLHPRGPRWAAVAALAGLMFAAGWSADAMRERPVPDAAKRAAQAQLDSAGRESPSLEHGLSRRALRP